MKQPSGRGWSAGDAEEKPEMPPTTARGPPRSQAVDIPSSSRFPHSSMERSSGGGSTSGYDGDGGFRAMSSPSAGATIAGIGRGRSESDSSGSGSAPSSSPYSYLSYIFDRGSGSTHTSSTAQTPPAHGGSFDDYHAGESRASHTGITSSSTSSASIGGDGRHAAGPFSSSSSSSSSSSTTTTTTTTSSSPSTSSANYLLPSVSSSPPSPFSNFTIGMNGVGGGASSGSVSMRPGLVSAAINSVRPQIFTARHALQQRVHNRAIAEGRRRDEAIRNKRYKCDVCLLDKKVEEIYIIDECFHRYCIECLSAFFTVKIENGEVNDISCPHLKCNTLISASNVRHCVDAKTFQRYEFLILKSALNGMSDLRWCPRPDCENAMLLYDHPNTTNPMMMCSDPECRFMFCANCREEWHIDQTCEQYQRWKLENCESHAENAKWVRHHTKPCPKCGVPIEKADGCNHMRCRNCRFQFCWLCMREYSITHFGRWFWGCPQFS
eukprot:TRINITY_DN339_c2_g1_i1.p1 TRINITY_DN339_c2_g1~~TRINITY_DN339_c2_g1_i1.p1  ORF type:complete len:494 (-),score=96.47 TRINITY_DN339_c2_g1_i1:194-1675(-)